MKNKILLLVIGCVFAMSGCGSAATQTESAVENISEDASATTDTASSEGEESTEEAASAEDAASEDESSEDALEEETTGTDAESENVDEDWMGKETAPDADGKISNEFMSITMPKELEGTYLAYTNDNEINIYEKEGHDDGYGGFVFGICLADNYGEYGGMRTKIGELTDADGKLHHVLLSFASEVQWDYTKYEEVPEAYKKLEDSCRDIASTLEAEQGGTYVDGGGTKGEDLYGDLAKEIAATVESAKDANELEAADLSPVYYAISQGDEAKDPMEAIGVAYADCNSDGVDEMFIGDIENQQVYDIFGSENGKPVHVVSGHFRDYYKVNGPFISEYVSESAGVNVATSWNLEPNSSELFLQYSLKLDETDEAEYKWAVSYSDGKWEELSEEEYNDRFSNLEYPDAPALEFKPLNSLK
ncbi:hypothetical protein [Butyrivibrio sp. LC3010]|uniref:hypothetical protein n=1 Tax=Butyrivibrio sp. LC3010 TaxID=1280680 RepID=UPI00041A8D9F|nr:hypothetical protein [Butyrivibrio sp. LC3010]